MYRYDSPVNDPLEQFKTDYPDIAGPVEKMIASRDKAYEGQTSALHTKIFEEAMDVARPDWRDLRDDPDFGRWMQENPDQQQAARVPGVRAALKVLEVYDKTTGKRPSKRSSAWLMTVDGYAAEEEPPAFKGSPVPVPSLDDALDGFAAD